MNVLLNTINAEDKRLGYKVSKRLKDTLALTVKR